MRYIESYVHNKGQVGVLLELEAEADAAVDSDEFRQLARDLVLQVAAGKAKSPKELLDQPFIKDSNQLVSHRVYVARPCSKHRFRLPVSCDMIPTALNNCVQATPVCAILFFLRRVPGAPDEIVSEDYAQET
jgi:translation elongation factor EF-Ts